MAKRKGKRKRQLSFRRPMQQKLVLLYLVIVLAFIILLSKVVFDNAFKGNNYTKTILDNQEQASRNIPSKRGDIMDSNGTKLATSERVYTVLIDTQVILSGKDGKYIEPTKKVLIDIFGVDPEELNTQLTEHENSRYYVIARDVPYEKELEYEKIMELQEQAERKLQKEEELTEQEVEAYRVRGIWLEEGYKRNYPFGSVACDLIGFATPDGNGGYIGYNGVEASYNSKLNGTDGKKYGFLNSNSQYESTITEPVPGYSLRTTIDLEAQSIVEHHILQLNNQLKNLYKDGEGSLATGVLVMNPQNGEIIAMASYPTYNLNTPDDLSMYYDETYYRERVIDEMRDDLAKTADDMSNEDFIKYFGTDIVADNDRESLVYLRKQAFYNMENEEVLEQFSEEEFKERLKKMESTVLNETWANFCTDTPFEPGSTAKPFTVAEGLDIGVLKGTESYPCTGFLHIGDHDIYCANTYGHGSQTLKEAISNSCNVALMYIGNAIGVEQFCRYQEIFGWGQPSGIDLHEADTSGMIYDVNRMGPTDLATNAFGQNFYITMSQLCASFCSLVNGGYYFEPHVVKQIEDEKGNVIESYQPKITKKTISEETSEIVKEYMLSVVTEGTATKAQISGYDIGGKTGTAEKIPRDTGKYVVSFIGYAPQENPEVVVYVVIDEPNVEKQDSGSYATILARDIMADLFPYLGITRNDNTVAMPTGSIYSNLLKPNGENGEDGDQTEGTENTTDETNTITGTTNTGETLDGLTSTDNTEAVTQW